MAGGHGPGNETNQLCVPTYFDIDDDGSLFIVDKWNHRIVHWKPNAEQGEIIIGGKGQGNRSYPLFSPKTVLIDRMNDCLIINDSTTHQVMRWPLKKSQRNSMDKGELLLSNIESLGLAMDGEGSLYVTELEKHDVRRYGRGDEREGVLVAGGNGEGAALNQLNTPRQIFVDADQSVYVSDLDNHRVMKWVKGAREGVVVAGGQGEGNSLAQLSEPRGIFVDQMGSVYVADSANSRVMRWVKGAKEGEVIAGGYGSGSQDKQLRGPIGVLLDNRGNLYVLDQYNNRVQRFDLR